MKTCLFLLLIVLIEAFVYFILLFSFKKKYNKEVDLKIVSIINGEHFLKANKYDDSLILDCFYYVDLLWSDNVKNVCQIFRNYKSKYIKKNWKMGSKVVMYYNDKDKEHVNTLFPFPDYLSNIYFYVSVITTLIFVILYFLGV